MVDAQLASREQTRRDTDWRRERRWEMVELDGRQQHEKGGELHFHSCLSDGLRVCTSESLDLKVHMWGTYISCITQGASVQLRSVAQSCPMLCEPTNRSTPGLPVHHQFPEFTQTHVHRINDAIQPSHPLLSSSPPASNPSQHQGLFQ